MNLSALLGVLKCPFQKAVSSATDFRSAFLGRVIMGLGFAGFNIEDIPLDFGRRSGIPIFGAEGKLLRENELIRSQGETVVVEPIPSACK